jgi:uncharacterized LabA/DUF88 family protein
MKKTIVYIDGFNFYYGCVKGTPYKWLDLSKLCSLLLPGHQIVAIKYFTAPVKPRPNDLEQPARQKIFLRALRTIPNLTIILGHFLSHPTSLPLVDRPRKKSLLVRLIRFMSFPFWRPQLRKNRDKTLLMANVLRTDEKGSDVNLATHLLHDAYKNLFDVGVIFSGDSDLKEAVRIVSKELNKKVGVINPQHRLCKALKKEASFYKEVRKGVLSASLFPNTMTDANGHFHKPPAW